MTTLFISDLHLCEERPQTTALFEKFIAEVAPGSDALYILGDLFEYWIGDDQLDHDSLARSVASTLVALAKTGTSVYFMHGNRDFLIGERFAREAGLNILPDPSSITINGKHLLLMHGDTLCTDDIAYQQFRKQVRDPMWQRMILAKPFEERLELARSIRSKSDMEKTLKSETIMDVNQAAVKAAIAANRYPVLIHGHTHRPARHDFSIDSMKCTRWVLSDWHDSARFFAFPTSSLSTISI
jgi:UDP-2,3-diacylglucosamine hydrolase